MSIHTILGAGGAVANALSGELLAHRLPVRLVSRHPSLPMDLGPAPTGPADSGDQAFASSDTPQITTFAADLADPAQTLKAVEGSTVAYLCVGLPYRYST